MSRASSRTSKRCRHIRSLLKPFLRGELTDDVETRGRVRGHISKCSGCSAALVRLIEADMPEPGPDEEEAPPLPAPIRRIMDERIAQRAEETLMRTLQSQAQPAIRERMRRWLEDFRGKSEGALKLIEQQGSLAVEAVSQALRGDTQWRFSPVGFATQGPSPLAGVEGSTRASRHVKGLRNIKGEVQPGVESEVTLEGDRLQVIFRGCGPDFSPLLILSSLGGQVRVQECTRIEKLDGFELQTTFDSVQPHDLLLIEPDIEEPVD